MSVLRCAHRCFRWMRPAAGYDSAISRRVAPEVIRSAFALSKRRAQGKPGAHDTRSRAQECTRRTAGAPEHPAFPAQWFYGLWRALPGDEFLLPPSLTDWRSIEGPVGPDNLHQLDTSHGCQNHTLLPSAASSSHTPRPARMLPEEVSTEAFKRRSSRALCPLTEEPPCEHTSRPTLPRPPQPVPTFVTLANAPLLGTGWREL
jgi:hypothetical protein